MPLLIIAISSQRYSASSMMCVVKKTVNPSFTYPLCNPRVSVSKRRLDPLLAHPEIKVSYHA